MMSRFEKRVEATTAPLSASELAQRRSGIEAELKELTDQRNHLALDALHGDGAAQSSIDSIDRERQKLAAQIETINAALGTLRTKEREQRSAQSADALRRVFERDKLSLQGRLVRTIQYEYDALAEKVRVLLIAGENDEASFYYHGEAGGAVSAGGTPASSNADAPGVLGIPLYCARRLVEHPPYTPLLNTVVMHDVPETDRDKVRQQRARDRDAHIDRLAQELVGAIEVPPMPQQLVQHGQTIKARKIRSSGVVQHRITRRDGTTFETA